MNEKLKNTTKQMLLLDEIESCVYDNTALIFYDEEYEEYRVFIEKTQRCGHFSINENECLISINDYYKIYDDNNYQTVTKRRQISELLHYIDNYKKHLNEIFNDIIANYNKKFYIIEYIDSDNVKHCDKCEIYSINTYYSYGTYGCNGAHSEFVTNLGVIVLRHNISDDVRYDKDRDIITYSGLEHECKYKHHPEARLLLIKKA